MSALQFLSLVAVVGLAAFWLDALRAREAAVAGATRACAREHVQLLDDTVVGRSLRLTRDAGGQVALQRVYDFEYSDSGNDRYRGSLMLVGKEVVMLDLSAHLPQRLIVH